MSERGKKRSKRSEIYCSFPQIFKNLCSFLWAIELCFKITSLSWRRRRKPSKHKLPSHELVAKIWKFAIRRMTLSACLFLMLLCQPYRMLDMNVRFSQTDHLFEFLVPPAGESIPESLRYSIVVQ